MTSASDRRETPLTAWLFDVDGVLTDPERKIVADLALFDELICRLRAGEPVGLNTGRSLEVIGETVLDPLERRLSDRSLLAGLIGIGEKGGVWVEYTADGARVEYVDPGVAVPLDLQNAVRALVRQPRFADCMFYDETKRTMISVELRAGRTVAEFAPRQRELAAELRELVARHPDGSDLRVDPSRIATDVEHTHMGKGRGAQQFVALLESRHIRPQRYVCFGDSASDYPMLEALLALGQRAELVFVGERHLLAGQDTRFVTFTDQLCDPGTLTYLRAARDSA